jgi:hypothetical protein
VGGQNGGLQEPPALSRPSVRRSPQPGTAPTERLLALVALGLLQVGTAPGLATAAERLDDFGLLQLTTSRCQRNLAGSPAAPCSTLRLEQNREGLLNVQFMGAGGGPERSNRITFVGMVREGQANLSCQAGRCRLTGPLRTEVTSVSEIGFDGRGLPIGLPKAWPAEGECQLLQREVRCQVRALSGERWAAEASL